MSGKKYTDAVKTFDRDHLFTPTEALAKVKAMAKATFDETVDLAVRLGVDPRKADQMVRGTVALPAGTGKDIRVAVFAQGDAAAAATAASRTSSEMEPIPARKISIMNGAQRQIR